jgi:NAD(P)-dependent dehydrogenase (short-subunit alcohol dehydrogenase family)
MTGLPTRTAIITGGAKRIGGAITRALAADGWYVLIHCNQSRAEAEALATELGNARVVAADLANPAAADIIMAACAGLPPVPHWPSPAAKCPTSSWAPQWCPPTRVTRG